MVLGTPLGRPGYCRTLEQGLYAATTTQRSLPDVDENREPAAKPHLPHITPHVPGLHWGTGRIPAWLRETAGEPRWPVAIGVILAIALQLALPDRYAVQPKFLLPALETALLIGLIAANPV